MRTIQSRTAHSIAIRRFVKALDQITRLLELNRKKKRRGSIDSLHFGARSIRAALIDIVCPEVETVRIRVATVEVEILLPHKKSGQVERVSRRTIVNNYRAGRSRTR